MERIWPGLVIYESLDRRLVNLTHPKLVNQFDQRLSLCTASSLRLIPLCIETIPIKDLCWGIGETSVIKLANSAKILEQFRFADRGGNLTFYFISRRSIETEVGHTKLRTRC